MLECFLNPAKHEFRLNDAQSIQSYFTENTLKFLGKN